MGAKAVMRSPDRGDPVGRGVRVEQHAPAAVHLQVGRARDRQMRACVGAVGAQGTDLGHAPARDADRKVGAQRARLPGQVGGDQGVQGSDPSAMRRASSA